MHNAYVFDHIFQCLTGCVCVHMIHRCGTLIVYRCSIFPLNLGSNCWLQVCAMHIGCGNTVNKLLVNCIKALEIRTYQRNCVPHSTTLSLTYTTWNIEVLKACCWLVDLDCRLKYFLDWGVSPDMEESHPLQPLHTPEGSWCDAWLYWPKTYHWMASTCACDGPVSLIQVQNTHNF